MKIEEQKKTKKLGSHGLLLLLNRLVKGLVIREALYHGSPFAGSALFLSLAFALRNSKFLQVERLFWLTQCGNGSGWSFG